VSHFNFSEDEIYLARQAAKKFLARYGSVIAPKKLRGPLDEPQRFLTPPSCEGCGSPVFNGAFLCPECLGRPALPIITWDAVADGTWAAVARAVRP